MTQFITSEEKLAQFSWELKELLVRFGAELTLERDRSERIEEIVVVFNWDQHMFDCSGNGLTPDLNLGRWEDGK